MNLRPARTTDGTDAWAVRAACLLACIPSGAALLAKVYGIASMRLVTFAAAAPCYVGLIGAWIWGRRSGRESVATALAIGFAGGLLGTVGYDLIRVPMHLAGQRVFAPSVPTGFGLQTRMHLRDSPT